MPASSEPPLISVAVCTRDPQAIAHTLLSLRQQSLARDAYEVLVIDNGSAAATAAALATASEAHGFRYVCEAQAGLSRARNRAIAEARGRYVHFIDDDAVAPAHLLETLLRCFAEESCEVAGGPAHGLWQERPPPWLGPRHWPLLSLSCHGAARRDLHYPEILLGCNMAFRRDCLDGAEPFRVDLGRRGVSLLGNEDREIQRRLAAAGARVVYEPAAYVFHAVGSARMTSAYLERRVAAAVRANEMLEPGSEQGRHHWSRRPLRQLNALVQALRLGYALFRLESRLQVAAARGTHGVDEETGLP